MADLFNPFPGLRPFLTEEKYLFFGREGHTAELLQRLRQTRFLAVVGTSGSGKSSLVTAGLLPELHGGTMVQAGSQWEVAIMRPGGDPLTHLATALVEADLYDPGQEDVVAQVRATLNRSGLGLAEAARQSDLEKDANLLVVVDQFEEIFRFRRSGAVQHREDAHAFVQLLLEASRQASPSIYVVLTMRSDYLGDCSEFPGLAEAVNESEYLIPRMTREQRRAAIEGPVKVGGGAMAPRLLQKLLNDVGDDPDQLPILQHALMRTWDRWASDHQQGEPLDLRHYKSVGQLQEALSLHADEVFAQLPDDRHRLVAEKLFKALTEKGSDNRGIRRPTRLEKLGAIVGATNDELLRVIDTFRAPGVTFLMPGLDTELTAETVIDISHESLMRVWRRLADWVEEEADSARIYRRLAETAALHAAGTASLYHEPDLQNAISWREDTEPNREWAERYHPAFEPAMAFLDRSRQAAQQEASIKENKRQLEITRAKELAHTQRKAARNFKLFAAAMSVVAIIAVFMFSSARQAENAAKKGREEAKDATILATAAKEDAQKAENTAEQAKMGAILQAAQSDYEVGQLRASQGKIGESIAYLARSLKQVSEAQQGDPKASRQIRLAADRIYSLLTQADHYFPVTDVMTHADDENSPPIDNLALSPDGSLLATKSRVGRSIVLRRIASGQGNEERRRKAKRNRRPPVLYKFPVVDSGTSLAFNHDGSQLASGSTSSGIEIWSTKDGQPVREDPLLRDLVQSVEFSINGSHLLSASLYEKGAVLWDLDTGTPKVFGDEEVNSDFVKTAVFSPDESLILTASYKMDDNMVSLWVTKTGALHRDPWKLGAEKVLHAEFSRDGSRVLATTTRGNIYLWEVASGRALVEKPLRHPGAGGASSRSDEFELDLTAQLSPDRFRGSNDESDDLLPAQFSPDGRTVICASNDGTVLLWDGNGNKLVERELGITVLAMAFSPDGSKVVIGDEIWDSGLTRRLQKLNLDGDVAAIDFTTGGEQFVVGGRWGARVFQNTRTSPSARSLLLPTAGITDANLSPDGKSVIVLSGREVRLFDVKTGEGITLPWKTASRTQIDDRVISSSSSPTSVAFSSNSRYIMAHSATKAQLWDLKSGEQDEPKSSKTIDLRAKKFLRSARPRRVYSAAFSPDAESKHLMFRVEQAVLLVDSATGQTVREYKLDHDPPSSTSSSSSGYSYYEDEDGVIHRIYSGNPSYHRGHQIQPETRFSKDGGTIVTLGVPQAPNAGGRIAVSTIAIEREDPAGKGQSPASKTFPLKRVSSRVLLAQVGLSPGGQLVAGVLSTNNPRRLEGGILREEMEGKTVQLWRASDGERLEKGSFPHLANVAAYDINSDNDRLATAAGRWVLLWEIGLVVNRQDDTDPVGVSRPEPLGIDTGGEVQRVRFSPDGSRVAARFESERKSEGPQIQIWDASTGYPLSGRLAVASGTDFQFSADSASLLTFGTSSTSTNQVARVWEMSLGEVGDRAQKFGEFAEAFGGFRLEKNALISISDEKRFTEVDVFLTGKDKFFSWLYENPRHRPPAPRFLREFEDSYVDALRKQYAFDPLDEAVRVTPQGEVDAGLLAKRAALRPALTTSAEIERLSLTAPDDEEVGFWRGVVYDRLWDQHGRPEDREKAREAYAQAWKNEPPELKEVVEWVRSIGDVPQLLDEAIGLAEQQGEAGKMAEHTLRLARFRRNVRRGVAEEQLMEDYQSLSQKYGSGYFFDELLAAKRVRARDRMAKSEELNAAVEDLQLIALHSIIENQNEYLRYAARYVNIDDPNLVPTRYRRSVNLGDLVACEKLRDPPRVLIEQGSTWKYLDQGEVQGTDWRGLEFDDTKWPEGRAELGFGDGDELTTLKRTDPETDKSRITFYFRREFMVEDPSAIQTLGISLRRDDGALVYLNGQEVLVDGMAKLGINARSPALRDVSGPSEESYVIRSVPSVGLKKGKNVVAVEIHQGPINDLDLSFALELVAEQFNSETYFQRLAPEVMQRAVSNLLEQLPETGPLRAQVSHAYAEAPEASQNPQLLALRALVQNALGRNEAAQSALAALKGLNLEPQESAKFVKPVELALRQPVEREEKPLDLPRPAGLDDTLIDLSNHYNTSLNDGTGWATNRTTNLGQLPNSFVSPKGVRFDARGVIQLESGTLPDGESLNEKLEDHYSIKNKFPDRKTDIEVGQKAVAIHFLTSCQWGRAEDGTIISRFVMHYDDDTSETMTVRFTDDVTDWYIGNAPLSETKIGWRGTNDAGARIALSELVWKNPHPDKHIRTIDFVSAKAEAAPFLIAITLDNSSPDETLAAFIGELSTVPWSDDSWRNLAGHLDRIAGGEEIQSAENAPVSTTRAVWMLVWKHLAREGRIDRKAKKKWTEPHILPNSDWAYWDKPIAPDKNWNQPDFDDAAWETGPAPLGYGGDGEATPLKFGSDEDQKPMAAYFRQTFDVRQLDDYHTIQIELVRDDGAVLYLNGTEVVRDNMPAGEIKQETAAVKTATSATEKKSVIWTIAADSLKTGPNLLAAEVHQVEPDSSDLSFRLSLSGILKLDQALRDVKPGEPISIGGRELPLPTPLQIELLRQQGDLEGALRLASESLTDQLNNQMAAWYHATRGELLAKLSRAKEAASAFDKAIKLADEPQRARYQDQKERAALDEK